MIVFLTVVVCWVAAPPSRARYYSVAVTIESPQGGYSQLFYDRGHGQNENDASNLVIPQNVEPKTYNYPIPAGSITTLRYDFPNGPGEFRVLAVVVHDGAGNKIRDIALNKFEPNSDIASIKPIPEGIAVTVLEDKHDAYMVEKLDTPLVVPGINETFVRRGYFVAAFAGLLAAVIAGALIRFGVAARVKRQLDRIGERLTIPGFLPMDHVAVAFYIGILVFFLGMSAAELHGSSMAIQSANFAKDHDDNVILPLLGTPKGIRVDEWNTHTPAILYQLARPDTLNVNDCVSGPGKSSLLTCIPAKDFSMLFHPQYWSFFLFPRDLAFSVYWQMKTLLLLAGTFTLLLMLTRSSKLAVFGALWFYFSPYTQWCFSWANDLPEMIGSCCLATVFACHVLQSKTWRTGLASAVAGAFFGLGFALLPYPPFQIPFIWVSVAIVVGYCWIGSAEVKAAWPRHLALFGIMCGLILLATAAFLYDIRDVYHIAANTIYPGQRKATGGAAAPLAELLSSFIDLAKREDHIPTLELGNICEGTGYYWLAPVGLLLFRGVDAGAGFAKRLFVLMWMPFLLLVLWLLLPLSSETGHLFFLDMVTANRSLPALGFANIAIVLLLLRFRPTPTRPALSEWNVKQTAMLIAIPLIGTGLILLIYSLRGENISPEIRNVLELAVFVAALALLARQFIKLPSTLRGWLPFQVGLFIGTFIICEILLHLVNVQFGNYFTVPGIVGSALLMTVMIGCLIQRLTCGLMAVILVPIFFQFALVNPIDRGFAVIDTSDLTTKLLKHGTIKPGKWLVYSEQWLPAPSFVAMHGIDVFNYFHYVPDKEAMAKFDSAAIADPKAADMAAYNQSGYIMAYPIDGNTPSTFSTWQHGMIDWHVCPTDPRLAAAGVRYIAFYGRPDPALVPPEKLRLVTEGDARTFDGFWIYERVGNW